MLNIEYLESSSQHWERVAEGIEKLVLRAAPEENRVLLRIGPGKAYPTHAHAVPDEVFVLEGIYTDPGIEGGKQFGPHSYLYYPAGTDHQAGSPTGCTILVWNTGVPKREQKGS